MESSEEKKFEVILNQIGDNRFITLSSFKGRTYVNIREYYRTDDGELRPGRKGIALKPSEWKRLLAEAETINQQLADN